MQTCIWPSWCHCHSLSLASVKSRLDLPFWYRPTRVVLDKVPLNGCVCVLKVDVDGAITDCHCYCYYYCCVLFFLFSQSYPDIIYCHHPVSGPCSDCTLKIYWLIDWQFPQTVEILFYWLLSDFSALTLLVMRQEGRPACKNWVVGCWRGYLSGARCRLAYGPADATATHCLLLQ